MSRIFWFLFLDPCLLGSSMVEVLNNFKSLIEMTGLTGFLIEELKIGFRILA